jgi:hypothetical protein
MKAYPTTYRNYDESISTDCSGMDLRDYFAAKAFQSLISNALPDCVYYTIDNQSRIEIGIEILAKDAYLFADAMMEARKK